MLALALVGDDSKKTVLFGTLMEVPMGLAIRKPYIYKSRVLAFIK